MSVTVTPEDLFLQAPSKGPVPAGVKAATAQPSHTSWSREKVSLAALLAVVVALVVIILIFKDPSFQSQPVKAPIDGMTIFAVFFVSATAIERLLEPLSGWLLPKQEKKKAAYESQSDAKAKVAATVGNGTDEGSSIDEANTAIEAAAKGAADLGEREWQRSVLFWAVATIVAMLVSASFRLYLLRTVGIAQASRWQEILATGLIIGAGTKPLHDLTELISAKKSAAENQPS